MNNQMNMLSQSQQGIPAHMMGQQPRQIPKLGLRQVDGFIPPREITVHGQKWTLIRDSKTPFPFVPNLSVMEWSFADNMELNFFEPHVFWYCLHGIKKQPGEKPVRLLFQWFHTARLPIIPAQISEADWQQANVYSCDAGQFETDFCAAMFGAYSQMQAQESVEWPETIEARMTLGNPQQAAQAKPTQDKKPQPEDEPK